MRPPPRKFNWGLTFTPGVLYSDQMPIESSHAEHPLLRIPTLLGAALGLALGLTRFILAIRENLQATPSLSATLFLAAMVGGVALLIVLFSAAVGFFIGLLLEAAYGWWCTRKRPGSSI